jgi:hypothetical protein
MKKFVIVVLIAFAVFYMMTQPTQAADAVRGAVSIVGDAFESLIAFISALFR